MPKISLPSITSGYLAIDKLNEALALIAAALENTLSRDGTSPNTMEADLDLNGHVLLNSGDSDDPSRLLTYEEMSDYVASRASGLISIQTERQTATAAQTLFTLDSITYEVGTGNLAVYVNGSRKFAGFDFEETSSTSITFLAGLSASDEVDFVTNEYSATVDVTDHQHAWTDLTNIPSYASRWPTYDEVTGKPTTFTPATHTHPASDITTGRLADARRGIHVQAAQPTANTVGELWIW